MTAKQQARATTRERLGKVMHEKRTNWLRQLRCVLTWPFFCHAYDATFVPREDKAFAYYEHCAICGRARSWVSLGTNHGKPGSVLEREYGPRVIY